MQDQTTSSAGTEEVTTRRGMKTSRKTMRNRKLQALIAGGLVLGAGAVATLAAWNDSEFATGTFAAGTFNLEGSTDGTTYTDHPTIPTAAVLPFVLNPTNLSPGDTVYAPFAVRLDMFTTSNANIVVSAAGTTGTVTNLTYELIQPAAFGCNSGTTGTTLVPAGTAVGVVPGAPGFALSIGTPPTIPGAPAFLCYKVTAGPGLVQGQTGTATWQFLATSV